MWRVHIENRTAGQLCLHLYRTGESSGQLNGKRRGVKSSSPQQSGASRMENELCRPRLRRVMDCSWCRAVCDVTSRPPLAQMRPASLQLLGRLWISSQTALPFLALVKTHNSFQVDPFMTSWQPPVVVWRAVGAKTHFSVFVLVFCHFVCAIDYKLNI